MTNEYSPFPLEPTGDTPQEPAAPDGGLLPRQYRRLASLRSSGHGAAGAAGGRSKSAGGASP